MPPLSSTIASATFVPTDRPSRPPDVTTRRATHSINFSVMKPPGQLDRPFAPARLQDRWRGGARAASNGGHTVRDSPDTPCKMLVASHGREPVHTGRFSR